MISASIETNTQETHNQTQVRAYAEQLVLSLGYNDAICTAMEFQLFNVAEELRFMQDDFRGLA
ncbi:hypothetical protein MTBPR1_20233 [Candidatus Terasakiella magnetica]|uniref:Uncharacterized protein n=1 Tax=Candidatus Terasakiella magnetica TaxID=1867952 RepID=A0A1C3RGJ0_9PROT|nr:hypothetical protein [Candidatus Terasakiella magnetica]SCA56385.1 hypothetical protein MTBPR1_20233 [Candidatus Terasakiella magnetica]